MKESKFVKTKIVAGYFLLIAVCILSVGYVYRVVMRFSAPSSSYALLHTKRKAVNRTLYHLYQSEGYGQLMIIGYRSYEGRYRSELRTVRASIDSLRKLTSPEDSLQRMRLDSITRLIADKERRTMSLWRSIRASTTEGLLDKNIRSLIGPRGSVISEQMTARDLVWQDSSAVSPAKRRLVRTLGDLFAEPAADSALMIPPRAQLAQPLMPTEAVKDTIALVLKALQDSVARNRQGANDRTWQEGVRLRYSSDLVNAKIYRLIMDFEAEDMDYLMSRIREHEDFRHRSSRILGGVAIASVVLMLFFVGMLWRDINRSNRYRRELERANRDKEALLTAREKLMLAITHDIKAPLGSVMGYIDLLSRLTDDRRQVLYLHNMKESSEHLLALVNSLLDYYRLDINKTEVSRVAFHPAQLFETIRTGFAATAASRGLELRLVVEPAARVQVAGDPFHIRQIADNLLSNALKFTDHGSVTLRVDVVGGRLIFSVRDTGRGIGREEKKRIFAEFVRLSSAQGVDGFGLGLSIVERLVKLLGGTISLESRLGEGSKFIVSVPVEAVAEVAPDSPARQDIHPEAALEEKPAEDRGLRVLIVDDDPLQLEMTAAMCRRAGMAAEGCQYPEFVAKLVAENTFDLVLTDIQMPSANGFQVLEAVHRVCPALRVVAVSARDDLSAADLGGRGFAGCLRKPFTYSELVAVCRCGKGSVVSDAAAGDCGCRQADGTADGQVKDLAVEPAGEAGTLRDGSTETLPGDFSPLTAYAGDDPEAARNILDSFVEQTIANCQGLDTAIREHDLQSLKSLAHKMLPLFVMLRAEPVAEVLRSVERHEGPWDEELAGRVAECMETIGRWVSDARNKLSL